MQKISQTHEALGTLIEFHVWSESQKKAFSAIDLAFLECKRIEQKFSRFRQDSLLADIQNQSPNKVAIDEESFLLFQTAKTLQTLSQGFFNIGVAPLLNHYGYDANYTLKASSQKLPALSEFELETGPNGHSIQSTGALDLGALGKGYALDRMMASFENFENVLINAGGDILCKGIDLDKNAWIIGLENPLSTDYILGTLALDKAAFAASSGEKRKWQKDLHHIMTPQESQSKTPRLASFVKAPQAMIADALSTLFYIADLPLIEQIADHFHAEFALLENDFSIIHSKGFHATWQV